MFDATYMASIYRIEAVNFLQSAKTLSGAFETPEDAPPASIAALPFYFLISHATELLLKEGESGGILNVRTGKPFDLSDPCVEKGPHVGYNAAAHQATLAKVREFLGTVFKLS
jgi:hypothetical protein